MNDILARGRTAAPWLAALALLGGLSIEVDEPQFASGYSRMAFLMGIVAILVALLCIISAIAGIVWALFFRARTR